MSRMATRGVRGAIGVEANTKGAIARASRTLMESLLRANDIDVTDIASVIFTVTPDLNADFPAAATRRFAGFDEVPLLCTREIDVPGGLARCLRVLMHVNTHKSQGEIQHLYLGTAGALRPDLDPARRPVPKTTAPLQSETTAQPSARPELKRLHPYLPDGPSAGTMGENGHKPVVNLAANENPLGPSPKALAAFAAAATRIHTYPDATCSTLRAALGRLWNVSASNIIVGNGSDGILKLIAEAYFAPGDEIIVADPTFGQYGSCARLMGATEVPVPLTPSMDHDLAAMTARIGSRTKAIFLCNPNNPTGTAISETEFAALVRRVPKNVLLIVDEAYEEYAGPHVARGIPSVQRGHPNIIVLRTFSKIYGLAGLRIGYAVAPVPIINALRRVREPFQVNAPAEQAALAALADTTHKNESKQTNEAGKRLFYDRLSSLGLRYVPTEANFVFFDTGRDGRQVYRGLRDEGIIVRSGDVFGRPTWLRATIGARADNERLFHTLRAVLYGSIDEDASDRPVSTTNELGGPSS